MRLRIATYNVHRCRGLDRRVSPARIVNVLEELDADIIGLQEVLSISGSKPEAHQASYIAHALGYYWEIGANRMIRGGDYGNVVISRFPVHTVCNFDISVAGHEERGCMRADVTVSPSHLIHVFNVHLGTAFFERRHQGRRLVAPDIIASPELKAPRVVLGDFNEWTRGLASRLLALHLESADVRKHLQRSRTYPGVLPFMHLDHIYHDKHLHLARLTLHKTRTALVASDHLPLVADFEWAEARDGASRH